MSQSMIILGRQPAIGLAELESLYGSDKVRPVSQACAEIKLHPKQVEFSRLGGSIKLAKSLTNLPTTDWPKLVDYLIKTLPQHLGYIPEGKIRFGLNVFDLDVRPEAVNRACLEIKKVIRSSGRSVRTVPNKTLTLSSAQTLHNQLTGRTGMEMVLARDGKQTMLAQIIDVQDIEAYSARDQKRPKRDARVGMLPLKLAQIIINLAIGKCGEVTRQNGLHLDAVQGRDEARNEAYKTIRRMSTGVSDTAMPQELERVMGSAHEQAPAVHTILDPFCGTGVLLQEALLMGLNAYGTDIEERMIEYSKANLEWLAKQYPDLRGTVTLEIGDATAHEWRPPFDAVASEAYLGRPLSSLPKADQLDKIVKTVSTILLKFLQNVSRQTESGFKVVLAVPAWKTPKGFRHLPLLDNLKELGYNRVSFVHVKNDDLIYHREGQIVGRELVVLQRT